MEIYKALTIAGSDTSGGAGIQADIKTFQERKVYGMIALTTIVTRDPENNWAHGAFSIPMDTLKAQIATAFSVGVHAMKTGMLGSEEIINLVVKTIEANNVVNYVCDPVMVRKMDGELLHSGLAAHLRDVLVPKALIVTPNLFEATQLSGMDSITTVEQMKEAAQIIYSKGPKYVLVKGGKMEGESSAVDVLYDGNEMRILESERIETTNTHGAGCTYSAAITAELAKGKSVEEAVGVAKEFITAAIKHSFRINEYVGPTWHAAYRDYE